MAHRSKKKHLKHIHEHEPATPKARSPVEKARAAAAGIARKGNGRRAKPANGRRRQAQPGNGAPKGTPPKGTPPKGKPTTAPAKKGIVRRLAAKVRTRITARPRRVVARVKARVKSLLRDHA